MNSSDNPATGGSIAGDAGGSAQSGAAIVGTRKGFRDSLQKLLQGIEAVVPDGASLSTSSGLQTKAQIVAELTKVLSVYDQAEAQQLVVKATRAGIKAASAQNHQLFTELKDAVIAFFGRGSPMLGQFGIKGRGKPRPLTPEQKVLRAAKARATRAARHTLGSRQKAALKSDAKVSLTVHTADGTAQAVPPGVTPTP
jgi:hypothetical protein